MDPRDLTWAFSIVTRVLDERLAEHDLAAHRQALAGLTPPEGYDAAAPEPAPPVLEHRGGAVALVPPDAGLRDAIEMLAAASAWTRTASYLERPPRDGFPDGYAHATLAGPSDGDDDRPVHGRDEAALGLLLLGPDVHYPAHRHPADEVYLPLARASWLDDRTGGYRDRGAGELLHHRSWQPHGTRTAGDPMLAVYLWTGDVRTPSRFC